MLTDDQIENILYRYVKRQDEFNMSVIKIIVDRLSRFADFDDLSALDKTAVMSEDITRIKKTYSQYVKDQKKRIKDDFWWIAMFLYLEAQVFYLSQIPLEENKELTRAINELTKTTQKEFATLINKPVFVIRDLTNPGVLKAQSLEKTYRSLLTEAQSYKNLSDDLRNIALKRSETQLFDSGIRYMTNDSSDDANDATSANRAVRFNVLENIKNLINKLQAIMGKQFGANGLELSAHMFPAPDHAPAQGHQYTFEEVEKMQSASSFKDVNGNLYDGFERQIGTWNCRHYFMQIKLGAEPQYSQEQLDKILEENERGYTDKNGKHRTLYECTQVQRRYEREIRKAKEKYLLGKYSNNKGLMQSSRNRVGALTTQYKQFSRACGIPAKLERIRVKDYI